VAIDTLLVFKRSCLTGVRSDITKEKVPVFLLWWETSWLFYNSVSTVKNSYYEVKHCARWIERQVQCVQSSVCNWL